MADEMGYQAKLFIGTAGSEAATQVTEATDVDYDIALTKGNTTVRGDGSAVPIKTENVTERAVTLTWKMLNDPAAANLSTILAAAKIGGALAIKVENANADVLFDGDCTIAKKFNAPLSGEASYDFTATPTKSAGRSPTLG